MPGRRLFAVFIALFALPLPACLHISAPVKQPAHDDTTKSTDTRTQSSHLEFAVLPRLPGAVVRPKLPANPAPSERVTQAPAPVDPPNGSQLPVGPIHAAGGEPGHLPTLSPVPTTRESPLLAAVRAYSENHPERAFEIIRSLDKQNQDFILAVLPILSRGATTDLKNDPATTAVLVDQLYGAAVRLETSAALRVEKALFCREVSGFGRFTPWPDNQPYKPNARVLLYLEVRNLVSQQSGDTFVTRVHAAAEVRDAKEKVVEQIGPDDYTRRVPIVQFDKVLKSYSPLHDFHVVYSFSAPSTPGVYTITVEFRDSAGRRQIKTTPLQFCVAGP